MLDDQSLGRRVGRGILKELGLFLQAFLPFKNIEPVDAGVKAPEKETYNKFVAITSLILIVGVFLLAYGLYPDKQIMSPVDILQNLVPEDTRPSALLSSFFEAMFYNALFIGVVFVGLGWILGVRLSKLVGVIRYGVYVSIALLVLLWCVVYIFQDMPNGGLKMLAILTVGVWFWFHTISAVIVFRILIKRRMGAQSLHPALLPLIETALSVRALSIALQGNATIVNLPAPHWVVAYGPTLLVIALFCAEAAWLQRRYILQEVHAQQHIRKQDRKPISAIVQPHIMRFTACLLLMTAVAAVFAMYK